MKNRGRESSGKWTCILYGCLFFLSQSVLAASQTDVQAGLAYKYDDNIYKQDFENISSANGLKKSGTVFTKNAQINSNLNWSKINVVGGVGLSQIEYSGQPELDNKSYNLNLSLVYALSNRLNLNTDFSSSRRLKDFAETDLKKKNEVETNSLDFGLDYKVNSKLSFGTKLDVVTNINQLNELSILDSQKTIFSINAALKLLQRLDLVISYENTQSVGLKGQNASLNYNKSVESMGLKYAYSPKTSLTFDLSKQDLVDNPSLNYSVNVDYQATPKSKLNISVFDNRVDSINESSIQTEDIGVMISYNYLALSKWNYLLSTQLLERKADALLISTVEPYKDKLASISLSANYSFSKLLGLSFAYTYKKRDSSRNGFNYVSNVFQINSNFQF